jgi:hypothetical protein
MAPSWVAISDRGEVMSDLREYRFRDWLALFLKAVPAFLLAIVILSLPLVAFGALAIMMRILSR